MAEAKKANYGNESISSLKGADRVRKRPGVIFGSDGLDGCEHAVFEILSNSIARFAGAGTLVPITGFANSVVSPAIDCKSEGFITGMAAKMFIVAGPVIVFGTLASVVYGIILMLL